MIEWKFFFVATCWFPYFSTNTHHIEDAGKNLRFSLEIIWVFVIVSQVRFQLLSSLQADDDDTYCSWLRYAPLQQSLLHCWKWITYKKVDQLDQDQTEAKDFRDRRTVSKSEKYRNSLNFDTHTRHAIILCRQISKLANFENWSLLFIENQRENEIRNQREIEMKNGFVF